ncbi:YfhE family protein [Virgibacillus soli]
MSEDSRASIKNKTLSKTQQVLYQKEFKRADRTYDRHSNKRR